MKHILFILTIFSFTLLSCKKDYTCSCVQTYTTTAYVQYGTHHPQSTTVSSFSNTYKAKKDEAESICKKSESLNIQNYGSGESFRTATETVTCEVK